VEIKFLGFKILALGGGEWSSSYFGHCATGERAPSTYWRDWMVPSSAGLYLVVSMPALGLANPIQGHSYGYIIFKSSVISLLRCSW